MTLPFWDSDDPAEAAVWNECGLGPFKLPGLCDVKVHPRRKLDVQEGSGTDYDPVTDKGERSAPVKILWKIWTRAHWVEAQRIIPIIWPAAGKGKPLPLDLTHPMADHFRVRAIVIEDIDPNLGDDNVLIYTVAGFAWGQPKPSPVKTADKSKGSQGDVLAVDHDRVAAKTADPFNPEADTLQSLINALDPKREGGKPKGAGAPSRDPDLLKPF
jgi:hypothetical protein